MAERKVKAAGGNSNAAATYEPETLPTASDDIVIASTSGNFTVNAGLNCRSLVEQAGYTGTLKHEAFTINIGTTTSAPEGKALVLQAGSTYTLTSTTASAINFISTAASTVQTIDYAGKVPGNVTLNAAETSGYKFASAPGATTAASLTLTKGSWDTGNFNCSFAGYLATSANTKKFILGSSIVTNTSNGGATNINATGTTMEAGTSTMRFTAAAPTPNFGAGLTYNKIEFANVGTNGRNTIAGANLTCATLVITGTGAGTNEYATSPNLTVTGKLTIKGGSDGVRNLISSCDTAGTATPGTKNKITAAEVSLENVDFMDIEGAGAAEWKGTRIGNALGNSGITFDTPKNRYLVVAGSLTEIKCWSATSGGAGGASLPLPQDPIFANASSAAGTYTCNLPRLGAELDCTGFARTLSMSVSTIVYGSLTFSATMTLSGGQGFVFAGRGTQTIASAGKTTTTTTIIAPGGSYTLTNEHKTSGLFSHQAGKFSTANFNVECSRYEHGGTVAAELDPGSSVFLISAAGVLWTTTTAGLTIIENTATFKTTVAGETEIRAGGLNFKGASWELLGTGLVKVTSAFTGVKTFRRQNAAACSLQFQSATTFEAENWLFSGTAGNIVTITASTGASAAILKHVGGGIVSVDYVSLKDSKAETGTWYAGPHSTNVSGNTTWKFEHPPATATAVARVSLASGKTPVARTGHVLVVRARKVVSGPDYPVNLKAALYESTNNRSGDLESSALTTAFATYELAITKAAAETIASYSNLEVRFWGVSAEGAQANIEIADAFLQTPEGGSEGPTTVTLIPATSTNGAQTIAARKLHASVPATATNAGVTVTVRKSVLKIPATETDSALTAAFRFLHALIPATETDAAQARTAKKRPTASPATEVDTGVPLSARKRPSPVPATETDLAQPRTAKKRATATPATETDIAQPLLRKKRLLLSPAGEVDSAVGRVLRKLITLEPALETDTAVALHQPHVAVFVELPSALTVSGYSSVLAIGANPSELDASNDGRTTALTIEYGPVSLSIRSRADSLDAEESATHLAGQGEGNI